MRARRLGDDRLCTFLRFAQNAVFVSSDQLRPADFFGQLGAHLLEQFEDFFLTNHAMAQRQRRTLGEVRFELVDHAIDGHPDSFATPGVSLA